MNSRMGGLTGTLGPSGFGAVNPNTAQVVAEAAIERARLDYASGQFDAVLRGLEPLAQASMPPATAWTAWSLLAKAADRTGRADTRVAATRATECFADATRGQSLTPNQLADAAIVFYLAGDTAKAASLFDQATSHAAQTTNLPTDAHLYRGLTALAQNRPEQAATVLTTFSFVSDDDLERRRFEALVQAFGALGVTHRKELAASYYELGRVHYNANRFDEALRAVESALSIEPKYALALALKGELLRMTSTRIEEAVAALQEALALSPDYAFAHAAYAEALAEMNRTEEAAAAFEKAIGLNGDVARWHLRRGQILQRLQRFEEALACLNRARDLQSDSAEVHLARADVLLSLNRTTEALEAANKAVTLLEGSHADAGALGSALVTQGDALRAVDRFEDSLAALDKAIALKPTDAQPLAAKGETLRRMGKWAEAEQVLRHVLEISPSYSFAQLSLANVYLENNREREALELAKSAAAGGGDSVWAMETKSRALLQLDAVEEGLAETAKLIGVQPEHAWANGVRGVLLFQKGDYEACVATLTRSVELDPAIDWTQNALATCTAWLSRSVDANARPSLIARGIVAGRRAVELSPDDLSYRTSLGEILWQSGGAARNEARTLFQAVVDDAMKVPQLDFYDATDAGWAAFRLAGCGSAADRTLIAEAERLIVNGLGFRADRPRSADAIGAKFDLALIMLGSDRVALAFHEFETARAYAIEAQEPAVARALLERARLRATEVIEECPHLKESPYTAKALALLQAQAVATA